MSVKEALRITSERLASQPLDQLASISSVVTITAMPFNFFLLKDWPNAVIATLISCAAVLMLLYGMRRIQRPLQSLDLFAGVRPIGDKETWPRHPLGADITERLRQSTRGATFFTGRSGAGKSTLFRTQISLDFKRNGWNVIIITRYADPALEVAQELTSYVTIDLDRVRGLAFESDCIASKQNPLLIIFDQLEQIAAESAEIQQWVRDFIVRVRNNQNVRVAAIVRQEFLYDIRQLGSIVPPPHLFQEIPGLAKNASTEDMRAAATLLSKVAEQNVVDALLNELASTAIHYPVNSTQTGRILPIELQIAGEVLEREWQKQHRIRVNSADYARIGGTRLALIRNYFETYIKASPAPHVTSIVLFALAVSPPPKSLSIQQLARATFSAPSLVDKVVEFLSLNNLVTSIDKHSFQLAHDALATLYREVASARLTVGIREAITYGVDHPETGKVRSVTSVWPHIVATTGLLLLMIAAVVIRLVYAINKHDISSPITYAIVAPAHLAWALFMYRLARNVFIRLPGRYSMLWLAFAVVGSASLAISMWRPVFWIFSMGMTALAVGASFWLVSHRIQQTDLGREEYRRVATSFTVIAMTMILGGLALAEVSQQCSMTSSWLPIVNAAMSIGFVLLSITSTGKYAAEQPATVWLSLIDRT